MNLRKLVVAVVAVLGLTFATASSASAQSSWWYMSNCSPWDHSVDGYIVNSYIPSYITVYQRNGASYSLHVLSQTYLTYVGPGSRYRIQWNEPIPWYDYAYGHDTSQVVSDLSPGGYGQIVDC